MRTILLGLLKLISLFLTMALAVFLCIQYYMVSSIGKSFYLKLQDQYFPSQYLGDIQLYDFEPATKFSPLGFYYEVQIDTAKRDPVAKIEIYPSIDLKAIYVELSLFSDNKDAKDFQVTVKGDYLGVIDLIHSASLGYDEMLSRLQKLHIVANGEIISIVDKVKRELRVENWDITVSLQDQQIQHVIGDLSISEKNTDVKSTITAKNLILNMVFNLDEDYVIQDLLKLDENNLLALSQVNLKVDHFSHLVNGGIYDDSRDVTDMFLQLKLEEQENLKLDFNAGGVLLGFDYQRIEGPYEKLEIKGVESKLQMKLAHAWSVIYSEYLLTNPWEAIDNVQLSIKASNMVHKIPDKKSNDDDIVSRYGDFKFTSKLEKLKSQEMIDVQLSSEFGSIQVYLDKPSFFMLFFYDESAFKSFELLRAIGKHKTKDSLRVKLYGNCFYSSKSCDQSKGEIVYQSRFLAKDGGVSGDYGVHVDFNVKNIGDISYANSMPMEVWLEHDNLDIKLIVNFKSFIDDQYHQELQREYGTYVNDINNKIGMDLFDNVLERHNAFNLKFMINKKTLFDLEEGLFIDATFKNKINDDVNGYTLSAFSDPFREGVIPDQYLLVDLSGDYGIEEFLPIKLFSKDERDNALSLIQSGGKDKLSIIIKGGLKHAIINGVKFDCRGYCKLD